MCVMSMVYDYYDRQFPPYVPPYPTNPIPSPYVPPPPVMPQPVWPSVPLPAWPQQQIDELKKLIEDFKQASEAAKTVDRLTSQPDCEDPDKVKLDQRVAELERRIKELEATIRGEPSAPASP